MKKVILFGLALLFLAGCVPMPLNTFPCVVESSVTLENSRGISSVKRFGWFDTNESIINIDGKNFAGNSIKTIFSSNREITAIELGFVKNNATIFFTFYPNGTFEKWPPDNSWQGTFVKLKTFQNKWNCTVFK